MKDALASYYCNAAISQAETGAFTLKKYEKCNDSTYLSIAAYSIYEMARYTILTYGALYNHSWSLDATLQELASLVSGCCDEGRFFYLPDTSKRAVISDGGSVKPNGMTWDDFAEHLTDFAKDVQRFYNNHVVPRVRQSNDAYRDDGKSRLTNFR